MFSHRTERGRCPPHRNSIASPPPVAHSPKRAAWPVFRRFGLPYAVLILITILPPMAAGGMLSMGRVTSILFPVFLWMGSTVPARHRTAWITLFACLQGFVAVMFFTWRPLY